MGVISNNSLCMCIYTRCMNLQIKSTIMIQPEVSQISFNITSTVLHLTKFPDHKTYTYM